MDANQQRKFDSIYKLNEQTWKDWDHKTKHEWKLSFGIWAALLAASATVSQSKIKIPLSITILSCLLIFIHLNFLLWIRNSIKYYRKIMQVYISQMDKLIGVTTPSFEQKWPIRLSSIITQLAITIMLWITFFLICYSAGQS